jgi:hypothetical protein
MACANQADFAIPAAVARDSTTGAGAIRALSRSILPAASQDSDGCEIHVRYAMFDMRVQRSVVVFHTQRPAK